MTIELLNQGRRPTQDYIILIGVDGPKRSPGRATISGAALSRKLDTPGGFGVTGSSTNYLGDELTEFDVEISLWEDSHWFEWTNFAPILAKPPKGILAKSLKIIHPILNRPPWLIDSANVKKVSQWDQSPKGLWTCRITMLEWRKPVPAFGKPNGTIPAAGTGILDFSKDPKIAELMAKIPALGGAL